MTKSMTEGSPAKLIFFFALPLIVGNIFQQFYSMADTIIVGRTIGVNALAAVGCTGSLTFLILGFVSGFTTGLAIVTAQRFGAGDEEGVKRSFATGILLAAMLAVVMTVISVMLTRFFLELLQTPDEIIEDAESYLVVIFGGIAATVLFNFCSDMMRALGDSRMPLIFLIIACCLNIVLDFALILIFHMGVAGAAIATIFSQVVSGLCCILYIRKKLPAFHISRRHFAIDRREIWRHLVMAFPMAFQSSIIAIGTLILQAALNSLGSTAVAACTAGSKINAISTLPLNSFGVAMATYSAQNYGAGKYERVKKGVFQCILMSGSYALVMGVLTILFGGDLTLLFVSGDGSEVQEVIRLSKIYLSLRACFYLFLSLLFIYRFTLQGLGNKTVPVIAGAMELIMRAFGAMILVRMIGFTGACLADVLAWVGAFIPLCIAYYRTIHRLCRPKADARTA